ncbi:MAG: hypothetical protein IPH64_16370 [Comamonadaceae bacterium]|nr:hypothetical protein [Comamonadaceae bacterium]
MPNQVPAEESQMPKFWYNIQADLLAFPAGGGVAPERCSRSGSADSARRSWMELILQEVSTERERSKSPSPCATSTSSGAPRRCTARTVFEKALGTLRQDLLQASNEGVALRAGSQTQHRGASS